MSFKDAGLGTGTTSIQITLSVATATATYQCFNGGGNHPKAANKETVSTSLTTTGTFPVRNGQTTGSLTVGPPSQGTFACPSGQTLYLTDARQLLRDLRLGCDRQQTRGHSRPDRHGADQDQDLLT